MEHQLAQPYEDARYDSASQNAKGAVSLHEAYASQHSIPGSGDATENAARHEAEQDLMYVKYTY